MTKKTSPHCQIVGYRRTSTDDQRLSIDAQDATIHRIANDRGCQVVRTYTEHESGGDNNRPELAKAIHHARRVGAILVVAKLDRLARDSSFLMSLFDGNVPIILGDLPEIDGSAASRFMVQSMANVAEFERRRMGERMRDWHRARKAQGFKAGTAANLTPEARAKGVKAAAQARVAKALEEMADITPIAAKLRADGGTLQQIADHLNAEGYVTRQGATWTTTQVLRVLARSKAR